MKHSILTTHIRRTLGMNRLNNHWYSNPFIPNIHWYIFIINPFIPDIFRCTYHIDQNILRIIFDFFKKSSSLFLSSFIYFHLLTSIYLSIQLFIGWLINLLVHSFTIHSLIPSFIYLFIIIYSSFFYLYFREARCPYSNLPN